MTVSTAYDHIASNGRGQSRPVAAATEATASNALTHPWSPGHASDTDCTRTGVQTRGPVMRLHIQPAEPRFTRRGPTAPLRRRPSSSTSRSTIAAARRLISGRRTAAYRFGSS
jgi:hypothetical protein